jgi:hypothetical protein
VPQPSECIKIGEPTVFLLNAFKLDGISECNVFFALLRVARIIIEKSSFWL